MTLVRSLLVNRCFVSRMLIICEVQVLTLEVLQSLPIVDIYLTVSKHITVLIP